MAEYVTISLQIQMIDEKIRKLERTKQYYIDILGTADQEKFLKEQKELKLYDKKF